MSTYFVNGEATQDATNIIIKENESINLLIKPISNYIKIKTAFFPQLSKTVTGGGRNKSRRKRESRNSKHKIMSAGASSNSDVQFNANLTELLYKLETLKQCLENNDSYDPVNFSEKITTNIKDKVNKANNYCEKIFKNKDCSINESLKIIEKFFIGDKYKEQINERLKKGLEEIKKMQTSEEILKYPLIANLKQYYGREFWNDSTAAAAGGGKRRARRNSKKHSLKHHKVYKGGNNDCNDAELNKSFHAIFVSTHNEEGDYKSLIQSINTFNNDYIYLITYNFDSKVKSIIGIIKNKISEEKAAQAAKEKEAAEAAEAAQAAEADNAAMESESDDEKATSPSQNSAVEEVGSNVAAPTSKPTPAVFAAPKKSSLGSGCVIQ